MDADSHEQEREAAAMDEEAMDDEGEDQYEDEGEDEGDNQYEDQGGLREEDLFGEGGGGYTTGGATSGDDDDEDGDYFATGLDVDHLLQEMTGPKPGLDAPQPFEILRRQRAAQQRLAEEMEEAQQRLASRPRRKAALAARAAASAARAAASAAAAVIGGGGDESGSDFSLNEAEEDEEAELSHGDEDDAADEDMDDEAWAADGLELGAGGEIKAKRKSKYRRRGPGKKGSVEVPEHISRMVGQANLLYASSKYQEAVTILLEVIRNVPNLRDPYRTLGALHEVMGQPRQALNFFIIAAHMGRAAKQDTALWHKLAVMSEDQGFIRQAIYCWNKVLSRDKDDVDSMLARARLYVLVNEPWRARASLASLLNRVPGHSEVVHALAILYHDNKQPHEAVKLLEHQLSQHYDQSDLTHINMLTDLYMIGGHYGDAVVLINRSETVMCKGEPLPVDLRVRRGVCLAHMRQLATAKQDLDALSQHPVVDEDGENYADLYIMVVEQCVKAGQPALALDAMDALADTPGVMDEPDQWQLLAEGYSAAGHRDRAIAVVSHKLGAMGKAHERYMESSLYLARLLISCGEHAAASDLLQQLDADLDAHELTLPEGQAAQLSLLLNKAGLHLQLGQREAFASQLLPQFLGLIDQAENNAAVVHAAKKAAQSGRVPRDLVKALKRHKMFARKGGRKGEGGYEAGSVFKGYVSRDRRKAVVAQADRAAEALLRRVAAARKSGAGGAVSGMDTEAEGEGDATDVEGAAAAAGGDGEGDEDLPAELNALLTAVSTDQSELPDMFVDKQLYGAFSELVSVLRTEGRCDEAAALLERASGLAAVRGGALSGGWWGPAAATSAPKRRTPAPGALSEGDVSDWAPRQQQQQQQQAGASKAEMLALKDSLRLMAAEVALTQGKAEEAAKHLKPMLARWPCSWAAWSLFCCTCSQSGRLGSWLKHVGQLRAKHPDSLPLQVLAAHADNLSGEQSSACNTYAATLQQLPNEPLLLLSLGCSLIDASLSRAGGTGVSSSSSSSSAVGADRNTTLLRGFAALHSYAQARGPAAEAEVSYNLGRAAHRIGLLHVAVAHYERVLQLADEAADAAAAAGGGGGAAAAAADGAAQQLQGLAIQQQQQQQGGGVNGMQIGSAASQQQQQQQQQGLATLQKLARGVAHEAAHNLVLIYRGSGAHDLAGHIMKTYLTM